MYRVVYINKGNYEQLNVRAREIMDASIRASRRGLNILGDKYNNLSIMSISQI